MIEWIGTGAFFRCLCGKLHTAHWPSGTREASTRCPRCGVKLTHAGPVVKRRPRSIRATISAADPSRPLPLQTEKGQP